MSFNQLTPRTPMAVDEMFGGKTEVMPTRLPEHASRPGRSAFLFPPDPAPEFDDAGAGDEDGEGGDSLTRTELREVVMIAFTVVVMAVELGYLLHYFMRHH